jgi:hypothetical protein
LSATRIARTTIELTTATVPNFASRPENDRATSRH